MTQTTKRMKKGRQYYKQGTPNTFCSYYSGLKSKQLALEERLRKTIPQFESLEAKI